MADEFPYSEPRSRITVNPITTTGIPEGSPDNQGWSLPPPPPSPYDAAPDIEPEVSPWERAAERIRKSNTGKLPTPELDWSQVPKEFMRGLTEGPLGALKSWHETTEGRYYPPNAKYIGDDGQFRDENNEVIPDQHKPNILPITRDPTTNELQPAMPGMLDVWNTIASPAKGVATLGAGMKNPFGGGKIPPPPPIGHNMGPPLNPPVVPPAGPPPTTVPPPPTSAPPPLVPSTRKIIRGQDERTPISADDIYTRTIDDLHPINVLQQKIAQHGALAPEEQAYQLARLTRGSYGRAQQALDNSTYDFNTLKNNGMSLKQVLKDVKGNLDAFEDYAVAMRDVELLNRGMTTGVTLAEAQAKIAAAPPAWRNTLGALHAYQNRILQYLADSGMLTPDALKAMRDANKNYVPFYRATDNEIGDLMSSSKNIKAWQPIHKIEGSKRDILSPLESIVRNTHKFIDIAEKNRALNSLVDAANKRGLTGLVQKVNKKPFERAAEDEIKVWKNGVPGFYKVDPDVAKAVNGMGRQEIDMVLDMISIPARTLRAGAVLAPEFLVRNLTRDQLAAAVFSKNTYIPYVDYLRGVGHMVFKTDHYQNWLKSGGANSNLVTMERRYVRDQLQNMKESGWYDKVKNNSNPLKFLEKASEYGEQPTRIAEFVKGQKKGKPIHQSGFESREVTVDFGRHGASQALRAASQSTAFLNPTIQGHDRLARAFINNPYSTSFKIGAYVTMPTLAAYAYNRTDPRMMDVPRQERDTFWHYPTNDWRPVTKEQASMIPPEWKKKEGNQDLVNMGTIYRIPKPHEMGVFFGSSVERTLDAYFAKNPEAFKGFQKSVMAATIPPLLAQAPLGVIEAYTNYRFFTESPLVPKRLSSPKDRRYEYTPFTTETGKLVGNIVGQVAPEHQLASPIVLENYVNAWFGTLGRYTINLLDAAMEGGKRVGAAATGQDRKPKVSAEWSEADIPVWRAFVTRMPSTMAQPVRDFYQNVESSTTIQALMNRLGRSTEFENEGDRASARGDIAGGAFPIKMAKTAVAVNRMFRAMEMIQNNRDMTPADKRKAIDMLSLNILYATGEANKGFLAAQEQMRARK